MRLLKQFLYGAFYFAVFFGTLYAIFLTVFPPAPPDPHLEEIQALEPLTVLRTVFFINAPERTIDLGAEIRNTNLAWGIRRFDYHFILKDSEGSELGRIPGSSFILPGETRWVILSGGFELVPLPQTGRVSRISFEIRDIPQTEWQKVRPFTEDAALTIKNLRYSEISPPRTGADLRGELENRSGFLLSKVEINGVIFGEGDRVLAIGRSIARNFQPRETRPFTITWPRDFERSPTRWEAWGHANFLGDSAFMRQFGE